MPDSGTKHPESRIHLFDPVGLLIDGYGGYKSSNYAVRPRKPTKSYDFADTKGTGGLRSYDGFTNTTNNTQELRSNDSLIDTNTNGGGLISFDSLNTDTNGEIKRSLDHSNKDTNGGGLMFGVHTPVEDESDVSTPRLWKPSSPTSPKAGGSPLHPTILKSANCSPLHPISVNSSPLHPTSPKSVHFSPVHPTSHQSVNSSPLHPKYHPMSPSSRTQAIAKGRKELMDMVRDLPESFYELSLKDIVDQKPDMEVQKEIILPEEKKPVKETIKPKETTKQKKSSKKVKKSDSKKKMVRSRSVNDGRFLLKTSVFPIFLGSKKNKKNLAGSSSFKVAPVSKPQPTPTGSMKGVEKDWWRRKSCISSESDESHGLSSQSASSESSSSSSRSNSSNGRRSNRFLPNCCFFNGRRVRGRK